MALSAPPVLRSFRLDPFCNQRERKTADTCTRSLLCSVQVFCDGPRLTCEIIDIVATTHVRFQIENKNCRLLRILLANDRYCVAVNLFVVASGCVEEPLRYGYRYVAYTHARPPCFSREYDFAPFVQLVTDQKIPLFLVCSAVCLVQLL